MKKHYQLKICFSIVARMPRGELWSTVLIIGIAVQRITPMLTFCCERILRAVPWYSKFTEFDGEQKKTIKSANMKATLGHAVLIFELRNIPIVKQFIVVSSFYKIHEPCFVQLCKEFVSCLPILHLRSFREGNLS